MAWTDNATTESGFAIQRAANGGAFATIAVAPARNNTGNTTFVDTTVQPGITYSYRVAAVNLAGGVSALSAYTNTASVVMPPAPAVPSSLRAAAGPNGNGNNRSVILTWTQANALNVTGFTIQRSTNAAFTAGLNTANVAAGLRTLTQTGLARNTSYFYRIRANNTPVFSAWLNATPLPITTNP